MTWLPVHLPAATVAVSRSMPGCASKRPTGSGWSACCAIAPAHHSPMERLKQRGADLVYRCGKGHSEPLQSDKYPAELVLTPLELIDRIAQLVPPPRTHRHRYYGVLAPNSPLRAAVTVIVQVAQVLMPDVRSPATQSACTDAGMTVAVGGSGVSGVSGVAAQPEHVLAKLIAPHSVRPLIHPIQCPGPDLVR